MLAPLATFNYSTSLAAGETVKHLTIEVFDNDGVPWGTAVGTGWTPKLLIWEPGSTALVATISGSWTDTPNMTADFGSMAVSPLVPGAGSKAYDAMLVMVKIGTGLGFNPTDDESTPFSFIVNRVP